MTTKFQLSEIPYEQFAQMGMDKQAVQKMLSMDDIERLTNGEKSNLKNFALEGSNTVTPSVMAQEALKGVKFFLKRLNDNSVELRLIEQSQQINNRFNVSDSSLERLKNGESVIEKDAQNNQNYIYQLDKETNSLMRMNQAKFTVPDAIQDIQLSQNQKEALRDGQTITLKKDGESFAAKIDFNRKDLIAVQKNERREAIQENQTTKRAMKR